jgi:CHAD domain-containing protein
VPSRVKKQSSSSVVDPIDVRVSDIADTALQKHFQKTIKHEADVLSDDDPEALHEMRIGLRRLRGALQMFEPILDLPKATSVQRLRKFARTLGAVRDLDVFVAKLQLGNPSDLPKPERSQLKKIITALQKARRRPFEDVTALLSSNQYQKFQQAFERWFATPQYRSVAQCSIAAVLPDFQLPLLSQVLLHSGWFVRVSVDAEQSLQVDTSTVALPENVHEYLQQTGIQLHDLRKQIKRIRYQRELLTPFYGEAYQQQTADFKALQEILGDLQDSAVLRHYLQSQLGITLDSVCPTVSAGLDQNLMETWTKWRSMQQKYLDRAFRAQLRAQILDARS